MEVFDGIVWADPDQVAAFQLFPDVLSIDSTGAHGAVRFDMYLSLANH